MPVWSQWILGAFASVGFHAALAGLAVFLLTAKPVEQAALPEVRIDMATLDVPRQSASESAAHKDLAAERKAEVSDIVQGQVSFSRAEVAIPVGEKSRPQPPNLPATEAFAPVTQALQDQKGNGDALAYLTLASALAPDVQLNANALRDTKPVGAEVPTVGEPAMLVQSTAAAITLSRPLVPVSVRLANQKQREPPMANLAPALTQTRLVIAEAPRLTTVAPRSSSLRAGLAHKQSVSSGRLPTQAVHATAPAIRTTKVAKPASVQAPVLLAWTGDLSTALEQKTLDTAAALRVANPGEDGQEIRDSLAKQLTAVNCARAQTGYDPETGTIELRGHVKSDADGETLMAAVRSGLQGALPIRDRLRRLPAPQCDVLTAFTDMPLPQSVEQFINPLIIGDDLHARIYEFTEGDRIRFELQGADYPGWLYLDYYDGQGRVLHLLPNTSIPPLRLAAEQKLTYGGGGTTDIAVGKLELRVSPPFGEDIVVAMVTSDPLFDDLRPTVEDAASYLAIVESRVTAIIDKAGDFRGEWVYLFVETSSGGE